MVSLSGNNNVFQYCDQEFVQIVPKWGRTNEISPSKFDNVLCKSWDNAKDNGHFRYKLTELETKIIPGKYSFVAQLNVKRAKERRKPQMIMSVAQPFNPAEFNFTKVFEHEILFEFRKKKNSQNKEDRHLIIINVSPLEYGNSLVVPSVDSCLPQCLTKDGIKIGMELALLSSTPAFRVGFNSLCANASVNHHHLHIYYLKHKLLLETIKVIHLIGNCYEIKDYPAPGFAFQLKSLDEIDDISEKIFQVSSYLHAKEIPQNLFITRGSSFEGKNDLESDYDAVRIFLWARKPTYGIKDDVMFNVACCELAGHVPIKLEETFETLTEEKVSEELHDSCVTAFEGVRPDIIKLLS